jgi:hypothetical protein
MWYELQYLCWECSGYTTPFATLEDVAHWLSDDSDYRPINVRAIRDGVPTTIEFFNWNLVEAHDIEPYDIKADENEVLTAYSFTNDEGRDMVLFIFVKPAILLELALTEVAL